MNIRGEADVVPGILNGVKEGVSPSDKLLGDELFPLKMGMLSCHIGPRYDLVQGCSSNL